MEDPRWYAARHIQPRGSGFTICALAESAPLCAKERQLASECECVLIRVRSMQDFDDGRNRPSHCPFVESEAASARKRAVASASPAYRPSRLGSVSAVPEAASGC